MIYIFYIFNITIIINSSLGGNVSSCRLKIQKAPNECSEMAESQFGAFDNINACTACVSGSLIG